MNVLNKELKEIGQNRTTLSSLNTALINDLDNSANIGRVPYKGWRLCFFGNTNEQNTAKYVICWLGLGALSDWFTDYDNQLKIALSNK